MIVARTVFYAKWGRVDELREMFRSVLSGEQPEEVKGGRMLTDLSGRFFKMVVETEHESLAAWEIWRNKMFSGSDGGQDPTDPMSDLVEWGEQEFYTVEAEV
jgi:hypothetical protein